MDLLTAASLLFLPVCVLTLCNANLQSCNRLEFVEHDPTSCIIQKKKEKITGAHTFMRSQTNLKKLSWGKLEWFITRASISSYQQSHITGRHTEERILPFPFKKCSSLNPEEAQHETARQTWDEKASRWPEKLRHLYLTEFVRVSAPGVWLQLTCKCQYRERFMLVFREFIELLQSQLICWSAVSMAQLITVEQSKMKKTIKLCLL